MSGRSRRYKKKARWNKRKIKTFVGYAIVSVTVTSASAFATKRVLAGLDDDKETIAIARGTDATTVKIDDKKDTKPLDENTDDKNEASFENKTESVIDSEKDNDKKPIDDEENYEYVGTPKKYTIEEAWQIIEEYAVDDENYEKVCQMKDILPEDLVIDLVNNKEYLDFVLGYPGDGTMGMLSSNEVESEHPLFMQYDDRWGYALYGKNNVIAVNGCGPTALSMAIVALTHQNVSPYDVAKYSMGNGFYAEGQGSYFSLMTTGANHFGINSYSITPTKEHIEETLDAGGVVVCCMGEGEFTTGGHFIMIYDYDENGFYINDSFCKYRSCVQWKYEEMQGQFLGAWRMEK